MVNPVRSWMNRDRSQEQLMIRKPNITSWAFNTRFCPLLLDDNIMISYDNHYRSLSEDRHSIGHKQRYQDPVPAISTVISKRYPGAIPRINTTVTSRAMSPAVRSPESGRKLPFSSLIYIFTMIRK